MTFHRHFISLLTLALSLAVVPLPAQVGTGPIVRDIVVE